MKYILFLNIYEYVSIRGYPTSKQMGNGEFYFFTNRVAVDTIHT